MMKTADVVQRIVPYSVRPGETLDLFAPNAASLDSVMQMSDRIISA
jgi:hypothetical protein